MPDYASASVDALATVLVAVLLFSVWFDVRERRIPNEITAGGLVAALLVRATLGTGALGVGMLGAATGLGLGILFYAAGAMGAGDGKLLAAVGAALGLKAFLWCLPLIGAFGGLLVLVSTLRDGTFVATLRRFRDLLFHVVSFGRIGERRTLADAGAATVPYGVAIAAGAVTAWLGWGLTP